MVTFGSTKVIDIPTTEGFKATSSYGDKSTYKFEFFGCENDNDRQAMLDKLASNTKYNAGRFNKNSEKISPKSKRQLSLNDYYIQLLESKNKTVIMGKLNVFQIASMYFENKYNINKIEQGVKCVLSYKQSIFANTKHKPLLTRLENSIEEYLQKENISNILTLYNKPMLTPSQIFVKKHNPPPQFSSSI